MKVARKHTFNTQTFECDVWAISHNTIKQFKPLC